MKTTGSLQELAFRAARRTLMAMLCFIALVSLWTPFAQPAIAARWFSLPNLLFLAPVPIATLIVAAAALWSLHRRAERAPFWLSIALFALSYLGLIVGLWPHIVPRALTMWEASSPPNS
jgi:cytochrome d ubiquinol oxidase subunit II